MRVLLINPHYPISETPSPPLGVAYIAGALENIGAEVKILDFVVYPYGAGILEKALNEFRPQMVGLTSVTMTFDHAVQILKKVKSIAPEVLTVMGGPHVTFRSLETLKESPPLDIVVMGEGEKVIVLIAEQLERNKDWSRVPSIAYRKDGSIYLARSRVEPMSMDQLPLPSRHLLPLGRYKALGMPITMTTSRGCPHKCIFCVGRKMGGSRVRMRSPAHVADELESIGTLGFAQVNIADDLFTANKIRCLKICDEILRRNLSIKWTAFARVDTISVQLLRRMKEAGCHTLSFGVESANPEILKTIRKAISPEQVKAAVKMCIDTGISAHASFILGLPGETPSTIEQTLEFAEMLKDMGASYGFHLLAPFPGTEVRERAKELGLRILTNDWSQYHANRAIVETPHVTKEMMDSIVKNWEKKFLSWLGHIEDKIHMGKATKQEAWQYNKLRYCSIIYELMMNSILEKYGEIPYDKTQPDPIEKLGRAIKGKVSYGEQQIIEALTLAKERGALQITTQDGIVRFRWS